MERQAEEIYLKRVCEKLKLKISLIDESIEDIDEEIRKMDDYYWENYNEFDEYGYENFDNSQSRQLKVNESKYRLREKNRYLKMLDSPYFARVDFIYEGEEEPESYYIGIGSFGENAADIPMVFDWRAPVSGLFYDYERGPAKFTAPGGLMKGEISLKRQYKIKRGKLKYFFNSDINIDDEVLKKELSMNGSDRLKNIVTTIQKEQNRIIRDRSSRILVVQGTAGSGKTSIALHRVAYLLYNSRGSLKASNILILSPNNVFADYISHILPELGEENICEMEFDCFAAKELKEYGRCEDRFDYIEKLIRDTKGAGFCLNKDLCLKEGTAVALLAYKQSREFVLEINGYVLGLEADIVDFRKVKFGKLEKTGEEIRTLFYEKFAGIPLLKRMEAVAEYAIDETETLHSFSYDEMETELIKDKFMRLYVTADVRKLYGNMLSEMGMEYDFGEEYIRYEDLYPMLYLKYQLLGVGARRPIKHLVIDEMQDYSYIQYAIIEKVFKCTMTILGDRHQTIGESQSDAAEYIRELFGRRVTVAELRKSYRQTVEIGSFAAAVIGETDIEFFDRHGAEPEKALCADESDMWEKLSERLMQQFTGKDYETAAILCYSKDEAEKAFAGLKPYMEKKLPHINFSYMDRDTERFTKGVTVTAFYLAKGLEFDCVHIPFFDERYTVSGFGRQAHYISSTRAMHELFMYSPAKSCK